MNASRIVVLVFVVSVAQVLGWSALVKDGGNADDGMT
jgi:hypothetical protein